MWLKFIVYFLMIFCFSSCTKKEFETKTFFAMGSFLSITIPIAEVRHVEDVVKFIEGMSKTLSDDEKRVSQAPVGEYVEVSQTFINLFNSAKNYYEVSGGKLDPTVVTVSNLYGFPTDNYTAPNPNSLAKAKAAAGFENITIENGKVIKKTPLEIGFAAEGKGYIADAATAFLRAKGVNNFIINAGGDMRISGYKSTKPFIVGIVDPQNPVRVITALHVQNCGIATSGNYERALKTADGKRINHIFNGNTFEPSDNYASVSVLAQDAATADALATLYYLSDIETIASLCAKYATPVLVIDNSFKRNKLCGWEDLEAK